MEKQYVDAEALIKYLTDWKNGLTGSCSFGYSYAIRANQTIDVLDNILTHIDYMLKENQGEQNNGKT